MTQATIFPLPTLLRKTLKRCWQWLVVGTHRFQASCGKTRLVTLTLPTWTYVSQVICHRQDHSSIIIQITWLDKYIHSSTLVQDQCLQSIKDLKVLSLIEAVIEIPSPCEAMLDLKWLNKILWLPGHCWRQHPHRLAEFLSSLYQTFFAQHHTKKKGVWLCKTMH